MNIDGCTASLGVLGSPIKHTFSPVIHNFLIEQYQLNSIYLPIDVNKNNFNTFIHGSMAVNNFIGFNVTVPYKVDIIKYCKKISKEAGDIGAVNTIKIEKNKLSGFNTDLFGFKKSIDINFPSFKFSGKYVILIGAGGAAKAVAYSLLQSNIKQLIILNRTLKNGMVLKKNLKKRYKKADISVIEMDYKYLNNVNYTPDLIINASSYGLKKSGKPLLDLKPLKGEKTIVYDVIYNPLKTDLLKSAQHNKLKTLNGLDMLILQALKSFSIWTDIKIDKLAIHINVLRKRLNCFF